MSQAVDSILTINAPFDILVLGSKGVGKTTLIQKYILGDQPITPPDTSERITFKTLELSSDSRSSHGVQNPSPSVHRSISIMDSSSEINDLLTTNSYQIKNARAMLFTYALDDSDSLEFLDYTINCITSIRQPLPPCMVVCLKSDNDLDRQVSYDQGKELAETCGSIDFIETCSMSQSSVGPAFAPLVSEVLRIQDNEVSRQEESCTNDIARPTESTLELTEFQSESDIIASQRAKALTFDSEIGNMDHKETGSNRDSGSKEKLTKASTSTSLDNKTQFSDTTKYEDAKTNFKIPIGENPTRRFSSLRTSKKGRCCVIV